MGVQYTLVRLFKRSEVHCDEEETNYANPDDVKFNTIDDVVYMDMKNYISFIIENKVNLYEQQSTYCGNMPVRYLISG